MAPAGETLGALIRRAGKIPVPDAVGIVRQVAERLAAIHATGTAHGNLRADDVQLMPRGPAEAPEVTVGGHAGVTPIGRPATVDDDVQTVGGLLYEMICGMPPLPQADGRPAPPASLEPSVPVGVADALMQALDPDPARRLKTMSEVIAALATSVRPEPRVQETLFMSPDQSAPIHRDVMARTGLGVPTPSEPAPVPPQPAPAAPARQGPAPAPTLIGGQFPKFPQGPGAAPGGAGAPQVPARAQVAPAGQPGKFSSTILGSLGSLGLSSPLGGQAPQGQPGPTPPGPAQAPPPAASPGPAYPQPPEPITRQPTVVQDRPPIPGLGGAGPQWPAAPGPMAPSEPAGMHGAPVWPQPAPGGAPPGGGGWPPEGPAHPLQTPQDPYGPSSPAITHAAGEIRTTGAPHGGSPLPGAVFSPPPSPPSSPPSSSHAYPPAATPDPAAWNPFAAARPRSAPSSLDARPQAPAPAAIPLPMTPSPSYTVAMPSVDEPGGGIDPRGTRVMPSGHAAGALPSADDYHDRTERSARRHRDDDDDDDEDDDGYRRSARSARGDRGQRGARGRDREPAEAKSGRRTRSRRRRLPLKTIGIVAGGVVALGVVVVLIVGVMSGSTAPKRKKTRVVSSALEGRPSLVTTPSEAAGDEADEAAPAAPRPLPRRTERPAARHAASAAERVLVETQPSGARVCRKKDKKFLGKTPLEVAIGGQTLATEVLILEFDGYARATAQLPLRGPVALKKQGPNEAIRLPECEDPNR